MAKRIVVIPDTQIEAGVDTRHIDWAGEALVDYKPDRIIVLGDWWAMPSLSSYDRPGSRRMEGARVQADIDAGNDAFERFVSPLSGERLRLERGKRRAWNPTCDFLFGNHENRVTRAVDSEPKYEGILSLDALRTPGFTRHDFLEIVEHDGIAYSHYFANVHSGKPIGGSVDNRLNKIGKSFVSGHEQGLLYGIRQYPGSLTRHGLVAGSFYRHFEHYRGPQGRDEWRGIIVLNEVENGTYDIMPLSMGYLERTYG